MGKTRRIFASLFALALMLSLLPTTAFASTSENNTEQYDYYLMNIPYGKFYGALNKSNASGFDAVSSATNKVGNYGKSGGAYHSGKTAETSGDTITAVGKTNSAKNEGVTWPVRVSKETKVSTLGGKEIKDSTTITTATVGRGQTTVNYLRGYECLTEAKAYSYL